MITTAYVNLKPGTTKTTSAVFTAAALHEAGVETLLVDADPAASAQRWADAAGGFPWSTIGLPRKTFARELTDTIRHMPKLEAVVVDTPQMEDHAAIVRSVLTVCDTWIVPVAPSGIEVERTATVGDHMDEVDVIRVHPADRFVLLTRTNRATAPLSGPDYDARNAFTDAGWGVFPAQVPHNDKTYRRPYGTVPDVTDTPYETVAAYLMLHPGEIARAEMLQCFAEQYFVNLAARRTREIYGAHGTQ